MLSSITSKLLRVTSTPSSSSIEAKEAKEAKEVKEVKESKDEKESEEPKNLIPLDIAETFGKLFESSRLSDVVFTVGDQKLRAHRLILAAASPFFEAMLYPYDKDGHVDASVTKLPLEVKIEKTDPAIFAAMLQCIYTDQVEVTSSNIQGLMQAAGKYQVEKLRVACGEFLEGDINKDNALDLFEIAPTLLGDPEFGLSFIEENAEDLLETEAFLKLSKPRLQKLLESDNLSAEEVKIFEALVKWGEAEAKRNKKESKEAKEFIKDLVKLIRFPTMDTATIASVIAPSGMLEHTALVPLFSYCSVTDDKIRSALPDPGFPTTPRQGALFVFPWDSKKRARFVHITAKHSRLVVGALGNTAGSRVVQTAKKTVNNDGQLWKIIDAGSKSYYFQHKASKLFMEPLDGGKSDMTRVVLAAKKSADTQKWKIEKTYDGTCTIVNVGSSRSLDISGASYSESAEAIIYSVKSSGFENQRFNIDPA